MNKSNPETTVVMTVKAPIAKVFDYIAPINLMHIFRGTLLIPGIKDTSIKDGWNKPGLVRTIYFNDGSTSQECLLTVEAPTSFTYKNDHFTSPVLGFLLKRLEGEWLFAAQGNDQTKINWTYRAIPTNFIARIVLQTVVMREIRTMLVNALTIAVNDLERGQLGAGQFAATT